MDDVTAKTGRIWRSRDDRPAEGARILADVELKKGSKAAMTSIIMRSALVAWGRTPPRELHSIVDGKIVTWSDIMATRRKQQAERLDRIRAIHTPVKRAGYIWIFYQPGLFGFVYKGWWAYLRRLGVEGYQLRFGRFDRDDTLLLSIMEHYPCGVLPAPENFELWKEAFGNTYARPGRFAQQGLMPVWVHGDPSDSRDFTLEFVEN